MLYFVSFRFLQCCSFVIKQCDTKGSIWFRGQCDLWVLIMKLNLQTRFSMLTVTDEEALQHVNQEMEAKAAAPFTSDRFSDVHFVLN